MHGNLHVDFITNNWIKLEFSTKNVLLGQLNQVFKKVNTNEDYTAFYYILSFMLVLFVYDHLTKQFMT